MTRRLTVGDVPEAAVEAAAKALYASRSGRSFSTWAIAPRSIKYAIRRQARETLLAAYPVLREGIAAEVLAPIEALAREGYAFVRWYGDGSDACDTKPNASVLSIEPVLGRILSTAKEASDV